MNMRYTTLVLAIAAWLGLGLLIGYQSEQLQAPHLWGLVQRYALAGFALVATLMASKYTADTHSR